MLWHFSKLTLTEIVNRWLTSTLVVSDRRHVKALLVLCLRRKCVLEQPVYVRVHTGPAERK